MANKQKPIIAISAPVTITAGDAEAKSPPKFETVFYTGDAVNVNGWDLPVVVDLAGLRRGNVLVANLDHDRTKRVGNFDVVNDGKTLVAHGTATAKTAARDEVVGSALEGYQWQSSLEVNPEQVDEVKAGKTVQVNGRTLEGPLYVARKGVLKGFAFVSHGADDNTTVTIAAEAASNKESKMKAEIKAWAEGMGIDVDNASDEQKDAIVANYNGLHAKPSKKVDAADPFAARKIEAQRRSEIMSLADRRCDDYAKAGRVDEIDAMRQLAEHAIETGMSFQDFRIELAESGIPLSHTVTAKTRDRSLTNRILEAALCEAGRLNDLEKHFTDQELQLAHDRFRHGISLNELFIVAAEANGYRTSGTRMTIDVQRAAFGMMHPRQIHAAGGFSTIDVANIVAATANKFLFEGWMAVDMTPMRIAAIRPVRNFQQTTTVSLTGHLQFEKLGPAGEIKHGTLDDLTYTNQADTYAAMLAITRKDIINDDLGALTAVPRRLGRGGALKLNDIFWTEFLDNSSFFSSGNNNLNEGAADATLAGLAATEAIFLNQTDYDSKPLGVMPAIVLVPTAIKATMAALLDPQSKIVSGATSGQSDVNVFRGRFRLESSPYMSNSAYTGYSAAAWYMLADPNDLPVIEIAALNGRVEPTVETADADFNVLGVQMRGYSDVGVALQEKKGGVKADGGAS